MREERIVTNSYGGMPWIGRLSLTMATALVLTGIVSIVAPLMLIADAASHNVSIADFSFTPGDLTIAPGDTVTWTNTASTTHTVVGSGWGSGALSLGSTYTHQFNASGDFPYHCSIHPSMTGTVHVSGGNNTPPPTTPSKPFLSGTTLIVVIVVAIIAIAATAVVLMRKDRSKKA